VSFRLEPRLSKLAPLHFTSQPSNCMDMQCRSIALCIQSLASGTLSWSCPCSCMAAQISSSEIEKHEAGGCKSIVVVDKAAGMRPFSQHHNRALLPTEMFSRASIKNSPDEGANFSASPAGAIVRTWLLKMSHDWTVMIVELVYL
jgi:hypothetical protein